jgi:protein MpaA
MIFTSLTSGKSAQGEAIEAFKTDIKAKKYIYLLGGVHGDEVEGVFVLKELFEWLKKDHDLNELPIIVIPILNIDGYRMGTRTNSHGVDLNRNLPSQNWSGEFKKDKYNPGKEAMSEIENQFLDKLFHKFPPGLILTFHSWKRLINYNGDVKDISDFIASFNNYEVTPDIGYSTPGSLGTYGPEKYNCPVITFECPVLEEDLSLNDIWQENEKGLKNLFNENKFDRFL